MTHASELDVTGKVQVSDAVAVRDAVRDLFAEHYPGADLGPMVQAFADFRRLFSGELPGFAGCDTVYHDMQHSLDVTLAMARLIIGHEIAHTNPAEQLGPILANVGICLSLFHDAGYIRREGDNDHVNGAQYTKTHVGRSADFLRHYLPDIGYATHVPMAVEIVHYTGYERPLDTLAISDDKHKMLGQLLGTADLTAQMSDRCYLEKCRDRLYSEFVIGGVAIGEDEEGGTKVHYQSGEDLLSKTPQFFATVAQNRLNGDYAGVHRFLDDFYPDANPYHEAIERNLSYLEAVLENDDWEKLRRAPPCFVSEDKSISDTQKMVALKLREVRESNDS